MGLLKTHTHTSDGLEMGPGTRGVKQIKQIQTLQQGRSHPSKTCRVLLLWRRPAEKALKSAAYRWYGGGGAVKALRQTNHGMGTMAKRARVHMDGNTGANTKMKLCENISRWPSTWRGVRRRNNNYLGWKVAATTAP